MGSVKKQKIEFRGGIFSGILSIVVLTAFSAVLTLSWQSYAQSYTERYWTVLGTILGILTLTIIGSMCFVLETWIVKAMRYGVKELAHTTHWNQQSLSFNLFRLFFNLFGIVVSWTPWWIGVFYSYQFASREMIGIDNTMLGALCVIGCYLSHFAGVLTVQKLHQRFAKERIVMI